MQVKILEVRDRATFIPVVAVLMVPDGPGQGYLLRRAGYGTAVPCVLLTRAEGRHPAQHDPYDWGDRTYAVAHNYIQENWATLLDGDVVDVEYALGEASSPKQSERADGRPGGGGGPVRGAGG